MPTFTSAGNANVYKQATSPISSSDGDIWVDTDNGDIFTSDGTNWIRKSVSVEQIWLYGGVASS